MKVVYQAGSRSRFEDMDWEAQEAVRRAVAMVEGKTGFRTHRETWRDCQLEVTMGHNIYTTDKLNATSSIECSVESHYMALAAEKSRLEGGRLVDLKEYRK